MDYRKRLRHLSKGAVYAYRCYARCAAFLSAALLIGLPLGAQAAVLKINPGDDAGNVINLTGELSASVTHTAEGLTIEIPGVEISLDCDQGEDNRCTVTIGAGANTTNNDSSSDGSGSGSSEGSGSSDDTACDPARDFGCRDGTLGGTGSNDADDANSDSGGSTGSTPDSTTTTTTTSSDAIDPCKGTGYRPNCNASTSTTTGTTSGSFPTGSARKVSNLAGSYNYGSAGTASKEKLNVASGTVTVVGLTMSNGTSPSAGGISFAQASNIQGVALRAWISTAPDGAAQANCAYIGYPESVLNFSINGTSACNLSAGGVYYFNMALCNSAASDLYCNQSGAEAAPTNNLISVDSSYID